MNEGKVIFAVHRSTKFSRLRRKHGHPVVGPQALPSHHPPVHRGRSLEPAALVGGAFLCAAPKNKQTKGRRQQRKTKPKRNTEKVLPVQPIMSTSVTNSSLFGEVMNVHTENLITRSD